MGLFEVQRDVSSESRHKLRSAKSKARTLGTASELVRDAWSGDLDPKVLEPLYRKLATKDESLALALARLDAGDKESNRALVEEDAELVAPLLAARLKTDRAARAAQSLGDGPRAAMGGAIPALRAAAERSRDQNQKMWFAWALAQLGEGEDLAFAAKLAGAKPPDGVVAAFVRRGVPSFCAMAIESIRHWLDARKGKRRDRDEVAELADVMEALGEARCKDALDVLHEVALTTPYQPPAMRALAAIADPSSRAPMLHVLDRLAGDPERNWPYRLGAEDVLRAVTPRESWPPLDTARDVLAYAHPHRYGWPKVEDHALLVTLALRALRLQGNAADVESVARFANAPIRVQRIEGIAAYVARTGSAPKLEFWDKARAARAAKKTKPAALFAIATAPTTVFRHNVIAEVSKTKDKKTRVRIADLARAELESRPNHHVDYYEESDLGVDADALLDALKKVAKDPAIKKRIAASTSHWIRADVLGHELSPSDWTHTSPSESLPLRGEVVKLGPRAAGSFTVGQHTNALAYSTDGSLLAAAGDSLGVILDAETGETRTQLEIRYNWAYGAFFSKDDKQLWLAYHGGHLEVLDAVTGKTLRSIAGHSGVPDGVRGLSVSPDFSRMLSAGSEGRAFLWSFPAAKAVAKYEDKAGSFYATAFSRDGARFAISHYKPDRGKGDDYLLVGDSKTGKTKRFETASSMWAIAFAKNGTLVCAGDGAHILFLNEKGKPTRKLGQKKVVRLAFSEDDKTLYAISETGEANAWDVASGKATKLEAGGPLWTLAMNPKTHVVALAGTEGIIHRFAEDKTKIGGATAITVHTNQSRGFVALSDGRFFSCGWDGRLLLWEKGAAVVKLVHKVDGRMTEIVLTEDERHVIVLTSRGALCFDVATLTIAGEYDAKVTNKSITNPESLAVGHGIAAVGHWGGSVRTFAIPTMTRIAEVSLGKVEISALAPSSEGGFYAGNVSGELMMLAPDLSTRWKIQAHGCDLVEGEPMGNPHCTVTAIAVHDKVLATVGTDDAVRLYDVSGAAPVAKKRILVGTGLFNNAVFSPSGARIVAPHSWGLEVYDTLGGTHLASFPRASFAGADEMTRVAMLSEDEIVIGAENGNIFRVTLR